MSLSLDHLVPTDNTWLNAVFSDFNTFYLESADCERKAHNLAMLFTSKYPKYDKVMEDIINIALGNLNNFKQLYKEVRKNNLTLPREISKNLYINNLEMECRNGRKERFLDRLMIVGIIELRGSERYKLVAENVEDRNLKFKFSSLAEAKLDHAHAYKSMATTYFEKEEIEERYDHFTNTEKQIITESEPFPSLY